MHEKQRIAIFIDGENFIRGIIENFFDKTKFEETRFMHHFFRMNFDFKSFFRSLIDEEVQEIISVQWYDARLNGFFSQEHRENQRLFFKKLKE